jgi:hypothetical protein
MRNAVVCAGFDSVPDGVAKVEDSSQARVFLVCHDHTTFDAATQFDHLLHDLRLAFGNSVMRIFQELKQIAVPNDGRFDDFRKSISKFVIGETFED